MADASDKVAPDSRIDASKSLAYWNTIPADVNGMLGGFAKVSPIDLQGSKNFITKISRLLHAGGVGEDRRAIRKDTSSGSKYIKLAVDCGAGTGRVTEGCLAHVCQTVDAVEPVQKFASVIIGSQLKKEGKVGDVYVTPLEDWVPSSDKTYDLIWNQWCLGHLSDAQLVHYLKRAAKALTGHGWIGVKENISTDDAADIYDDLDSSVTRSNTKFRALFEQAGLTILRSEIQTGFPRSLGLFPVRMYALRPE